MNKIARNKEKKKLKQRLKEMLVEMEISKRFFLKNLPKVTGQGYDYDRSSFNMRNSHGHKPSLRQRVAILHELVTTSRDLKKAMEKQKDEIEKNQEEKSRIIKY